MNSRSKPRRASDGSVSIDRLRPSEGKIFLSLIDALADFEHLKRPNRGARRRLLRDAIGRRRRFDAYLLRSQGKAAGYAIVYETYSSFLARPTLYLEDLFVLPSHRGRGHGLMLFNFCRDEAKRRRCGRMEWTVLDWNRGAITFYKRQGARHMNEWLLYRITF